jgi:hypothetical protein
MESSNHQLVVLQDLLDYKTHTVLPVRSCLFDFGETDNGFAILDILDGIS